MSEKRDVAEEQVPRREREMQRHRTEALEAAERLLARMPYSAISVQQIAEEAEFSVGYLYKLFPSKDELYLTLVQLRKNEVLDLFRKTVEAAETFEDGLTKLLDRIHRWFEEHEGFARDNQRELMVLFQRHHGHREIIEETDAKMSRPVVELFRKGIEEGVVGGAAPEIMAGTFRALTWGYMVDDSHQAAKSRIDHCEHIVNIILRSFSPHWKEHD